jgi:acetyl esterase
MSNILSGCPELSPGGDVSNAMKRIPIPVQSATLRGLFALPKGVQRLIAGKPERIDGQELALDAQLLLRMQRLAGVSLGGGTPAQARATLAASGALLGGKPINPVHTRTVTIPVDGGTIDARLYTPEGLAAGSPMLVFYHGGGWVIGDIESHDAPCRFIAKHGGVRVLSVDYRLAPEYPFPTPVNDALAAFDYAYTHAEELGADPARLAVGGDSAGGNLAAVTAHQTVRAGNPHPAFQLLFYPGIDGTTRRRSRDLFAKGYFLTDADMTWFVDHYVPTVDDRSDPRFSVLLADDHSGLPPAYIATAGFDPLRDEGEAYAQKLTEAGVSVVLSRQEDLIHGYANFIPLGGRFREALSEAVGALRTGLNLTNNAPAMKNPKAAR